MRILMIAPEPFFEPRGTPFSEFHRIKALTALGHSVDLVTYPFGSDVSMPGLRIFRSFRPPFLHGVKIGPSFAKLPLDALLALSALRRAVSVMRMTSPPMLLGRKLLKKMATRYEESSSVRGTCTLCASSSTRQRQVLASTCAK